MGVDAQMAVVIDREVTEQQLADWNGALHDEFGTWPPSPHNGYRYTRALHGQFHDEHGRPLGERGVTVLEVELDGARYYGPGYERGNLFKILHVAAFVQKQTGGRLYYGPDTDSRLAPLGADTAADLIRHRFGPDGDAYYNR